MNDDPEDKELAELRIAWAASSPPVVLDKDETPTIFVRRNRNIFYANDEMQPLTGYGVLELVGNPVKMLVPLDRRAQHDKYVDTWFYSPRSRKMGEGKLNIQLLHKSGDLIDVTIGLSACSFRPDILVKATIIRRLPAPLVLTPPEA